MSNRLKIKPGKKDRAWAAYQKLLKQIEEEKEKEIAAGAKREDLEGEHVNCYVCSACKSVKRVRILDYGTTPFMGMCDRCHGEATSTFFKDVDPGKPFSEEWYRPGFEEFFSIYKRDGRAGKSLLDHILSGGLISRTIKS